MITMSEQVLYEPSSSTVTDNRMDPLKAHHLNAFDVQQVRLSCCGDP